MKFIALLALTASVSGISLHGVDWTKPLPPVEYAKYNDLPYPTPPQGPLPLTNPHFGNGDDVSKVNAKKKVAAK